MAGGNSTIESQIYHQTSHDFDCGLYQSQTSILANSLQKFHTAVEHGEESAVRAILKTGIDIDAPNKDGLTALMIAVFQEDQPIIKLLLEYGASTATRYAAPERYDYLEPKWTVLHYAVKFGTEEIVHLLLTVQPNLEIASSEIFNRVINYAFRRGNSRLIEHLLRGKDVSKLDLNSSVKEFILVKKISAIDLLTPSGYCAILLAIEERRLQPVKWLLEGGARLHISKFYDSTHRITFKSCSVFHIAVVWYLEKQDEELIRLLSNYCDVNETTGCDLTALDIAVWNNKPELVKMLINLGADVNRETSRFTINDSPTSPLQAVIFNFDLSMLEFFLGTNKVSLENLVSVASNVNCLSRNSAALILQFLITDRYKRPENERLVLHLAIKSHNQEMIDYFCNHKSNVPLMEWRGMYPVHRAAKCNNIDCLIRLVDLGANIEIKDRIFGRSALEFAVEKLNGSIISFLLNKGANVDVLKNEPDKVLPYAFKYQNSEICELLLDAGVQIYLSDLYAEHSMLEFCLIVVRRHIIKLRTANMDIDPDYMRYHESFGYILEDDKLSSECIREIDKLKMEMISETSFVSYHKFLTNDVRRLANYTRNSDIVSRFNPDQVEVKFPIYGRMIISSFYGAFNHSQLIQHVENVLSDLFHDLPFSFISNVPSYLDDKSLRILSHS